MTSEGAINSLNLFYPHKKLRNNLTATIFLVIVVFIDQTTDLIIQIIISLSAFIRCSNTLKGFVLFSSVQFFFLKMLVFKKTLFW